MAQSVGRSTEKALIRVDVTSDTVCPWCFVGKRNLEKAMNSSKDLCNFEVWWHPFLLNPTSPKEGIKKSEFYKQKFGFERSNDIINRMTEVFRGVGLEYDTNGLTGSTLESHRLITFAGKQGFEKQNALVEELFLNYFSQGKYIGDREVLLEAARKVGVDGASEFLEDPNNGLKEVTDEIEKHSAVIRGVPYFVINGKHKLNGAQPPEVFLSAFKVAANDST
ncbi:uncharacterized protein LOC143849967 [Tasmannia lanceolata]|uniref:uncharacterized protein LOC143849967 n=1 Tax=Tasmannia lanceolata TaxID=3420 RepID=UPI004064578E